MAALLPVGPGRETDTCSVMAWGFDPDRMERDPFGGAQASVVESLARLVALRLRLQEGLPHLPGVL